MASKKMWAALVAAGCLVFASCGGSDDSGGPAAEAGGTTEEAADTAGGGADQPADSAGDEGQPVEGGVLKVVDARPIQSLDPLAVPNYSPFVAKFFALYDGLVVDGEEGAIEPRLAESLETSDGTTWTLKLRSGLVFSDGTPLDAAAVKFNWERFQGSDSSFASTAESIASMKVVDEQTLSFKLKEPDFAFDTVLSQTPLNFIGSPTAIEELGADFGKSPVGAGAFVLKKFDPDTAVVFDRNDKFYGDVFLDGVEFQIIPDARAAYNSIQAGGADIMISTELSLLGEARENPDLEVAENVYHGGASIVFNMSKPPFDDIRARQAIALIVDREALNDAIYGGEAEVPTSLFREDSAFVAEDLPLPTPNRDEAQALLDELAADGKPLEIKLLTIDTQRDVAEWLVAELQSYDNVTVEIDGLYPAVDYATRVYDGDFEAAASANFWADVDVQMADVFVSDRPLNYAKYSNEEVDKAFAELRLTDDEEERRQLIHDVQEHILEDLPLVLTYRQSVALIGGEHVHGERLTAQRVLLLDEIWLDQ